MNLLTEAMNSLGAALLPVVAALLLEELTYGGLVRLLVAPWGGRGKAGPPAMGLRRWGAKAGSATKPGRRRVARKPICR
jgi:hypothetical protein